MASTLRTTSRFLRSKQFPSSIRVFTPPSRFASNTRPSGTTPDVSRFQEKLNRWHRFEDPSEEIRTVQYRNPLNYVELRRQAFRRNQIANKRLIFYGTGIVLCLVAQVYLLFRLEPKGADPTASERLDAPPGVPQHIDGQPVTVLEKPGPAGVKIGAGADLELVATGTSAVPHFPTTVRLPTSSAASSEEEYSLIGLGIRTVSFLRVQVYVLGLYVRNSDLPELQKAFVRRVNPLGSSLVPGEKDALRDALLDAERGEKAWNAVLTEAGVRSAVRIVPVRNTDFNHLRDGWVRGITARVQDAAKKGSKEFDDEGFGEAMKAFKGMFGGRGKAPKGSVVTLLRDERGALSIWFQDKDVSMNVGKIEDERIGRQVWLGYLAGKNVSSEPARQSVVEGVLELVSRPVGTVGVGAA